MSFAPQSVATALTDRRSFYYSSNRGYCYFDAYKVNWYNKTALEISDDAIYTLGLEYTLLSDDTYAVSIGTATDKDIIIPYEYDGKMVSQISEDGFKDVENINTVIIPSSVEKIGANAFYNSSVTEVYLSAPEKWSTDIPFMYSESYGYETGNVWYGDYSYVSGSVKYGCDLTDPEQTANALKGEVTVTYTVPTSKTSSTTKTASFEWFQYEWICNR